METWLAIIESYKSREKVVSGYMFTIIYNRKGKVKSYCLSRF